MRILLDECVDRRLAREIVGHDVATVHQTGLTGVKNGELLRLAAGRFDVFVTVDGNLPYQTTIASSDLRSGLARTVQPAGRFAATCSGPA